MGRKNMISHIQYPSEGPIHYQDLIWAVKLFVNNEDLDWKPSYFIMDDTIQEREAIK